MSAVELFPCGGHDVADSNVLSDRVLVTLAFLPGGQREKNKKRKTSRRCRGVC